MRDPATTLYLLSVAAVAPSAPAFVARFRAARASARPPVKVPPPAVMLVLEAIKVATFSALAVAAGPGATEPAMVRAPALAAFARDGAGAALTVLAGQGPAAALAAACAVALERLAARALPPLAPDARDAMPLATRLTAVFYMALSIELWFRWGVLGAAASALRRAGLDPAGAALGGALLSALAYGVFALPSALSRARGSRGAAAAHAMLRVGAPSVAYAFAAIARGFECAVIAHAGAFVVASVLEALAERRARSAHGAPVA